MHKQDKKDKVLNNRMKYACSLNNSSNEVVTGSQLPLMRCAITEA